MINNNKNICFVIPTYNEAGNIQTLLEQLMALDSDWQVLIVDDESPDGTAKIVQSFRTKHSRVHLSSGKKHGLGAAYKRGMVMAISKLDAKIVVQMDADFSHDPTETLHLIELLRNGADVAIGSRYVKNASIDTDWHFLRLLLSQGGNWLARRIADISGVIDCTSGFRAIRSHMLESVNVGQMPVNGYAFQIALLHRLILYDARVVEHPIHFQNRLHGKTKLGLLDLLEFFMTVWVLRFPNIKIFSKFALTGLSGVMVNLTAFYFLLEIGIHKYIASPVAIEISILSNFLLNNYWTFGHREMIGNKLVRGLRFNAVSFGTLCLSFATFIALSEVFPAWSPLVRQAIAIVPASIFNYFINSYWTFHEHKPTANR